MRLTAHAKHVLPAAPPSPMSHLHAPALFAGIALLAPGALLAQSAEVIQLPSVRVTAEAEADGNFNPAQPPSINKSSVPLSQTPQSITVVPRAVLDSQQAQTLADALHNVPGVVSNQYGRRGWDDLIIRGQVASDSLFVDGLRTAASNRVAEQLFGLEQVEVLKGPASLLYGLVLPGGLVNMVSKRPQPEAFANIETTVGSNDLYQGSLDMGIVEPMPLSLSRRHDQETSLELPDLFRIALKTPRGWPHTLASDDIGGRAEDGCGC